MSSYVIYLRELIIVGHKNISRYKKYIMDLKTEIESLDLIGDNHKKFPAEIYDEYNDKISNVYDKLINLFGDLTADAMSYYKFRKLADKNNIGLNPLTDDIKEHLKEMNNARNWSHHVPESLLNARLEAMGEMADEMNENPVYVSYFHYYEGIWLVDMYNSHTAIYENFSNVFQQMKKDYSILIGERITVKKQFHDMRTFEGEIAIPKLSYEMQNKKYKKDID